MNTPHPASRAIRHNQEQHRFECIEAGYTCVLDYTLHGKQMTITHTGVPEAVGGRGIAAELTQYTLNAAQANGWTVHPVCSYAIAYIRKHPEYQSLTV
ncbi:MAG: GNAT family N-acetyltransferase [Burkholderiaceae bacterium]